MAVRAPFLALALVMITAPALAAPKAKTIQGEIVKFECGDNCYLTIRTSPGVEQTGLCTAVVCNKWNERTSMPSNYVGKRVMITVGPGKQLYGDGQVAGDFPAFMTIKFAD